jgi:uncharacterized membrane protein YadS
MKKQDISKKININSFIIGLISGAILVAASISIHDTMPYSSINMKALLFSMLLGISIGLCIIAIALNIIRR